MSRLATRRLIDASAALDAADRALLNLWVNRGLDDESLARMTGMTVEALASRRARIVEHLSGHLGLPPEEIRGALDNIVAPPDAIHEAGPGAPGANGSAPSAGFASAPPSTNGTAPPQPDDASSMLTDTPPPQPDEITAAGGEPSPVQPGDAEAAPVELESPSGSSSARPRWLWTSLALFVIVVVAVVLVVSLASGGGKQRRRPAPHLATASTRTVPPVSPTSPSPSPTVSRPSTQALGALPGGLDHASGTVLVTDTKRKLRLELSVSNLTPAVKGHYEVWLYNSIIDSAPLGRLRAGVTHVSLPLPSNAHRYRWIDISFQPLGFVFPSGESVLRSANPLSATRKLPQTRSARRRQLRHVSGSSSASTSK
jgi:hypothetical protein